MTPTLRAGDDPPVPHACQCNITGSVSVCQGTQNVAYNTTTTGINNATYLWSQVSGPAVTFDTPNAASTTVDFGGPGVVRIRCLITDDGTGGCEDCTPILDITVHPELVVDAGPDQSICETSTVSLGGTSNGTNCLWTTGGDGSFNVGQTIYTPGSADISNGNVTLTYTCDAIAPCTGTAFDSMLVTINANPSCVITALTPCENTIGNVASVPAAFGSATYTWSVTGNGFLVGGQNTPSITYTTTGPGIVTISVSIADGHVPACICSNSVNLNVLPKPDATITHNAGGPLCPNWAGYVASVPAIGPCGVGGPATYLWSISAGGTIIGPATQPSVSFKVGTPPPNTVTLSVTVTGCNGCSTTNSVVFNVCTSAPCQTGKLRLIGPMGGCFKDGDFFNVQLWMEDVTCPAAGFQAFLKYDHTKVQYVAECSPNPIVSSTYTTTPFNLQTSPICGTVGSLNHPVLGKINLANGTNVLAGAIPATGTHLLATLKFKVISDTGCDGVYVDFRPDPYTLSPGDTLRPPTRLTDLSGYGFGTIADPGVSDPGLLVFPPASIRIDGTKPTVTAGTIASCYPDLASAENAALAATTTSDNCSPCAVTKSVSSSGASCDISITVTAEDCCNNSDFVTYNTRVDNTAPVITCPTTPITIQCDASTLPANTGTATATDNCDAAIDIAITYLDAITPPPPGCADYDITRTWTATDFCGNSASCVQTIQVRDTTAPVITCPPAATIECDEWAFSSLPGIPFGQAEGGIMIYYNNNGGGENPANQAYLKTQFSYANTNGAKWTFSNVPLTGTGPLTWANIFNDLGQFGFDFVLDAPSHAGPPATPYLLPYDNTNNSVAGRVVTAPGNAVLWKIADYKDGAPNGPINPLNVDINSLIRAFQGASPTSPNLTNFTILQSLSLSGTVYTAQVSGQLQSDNFIHWYNPLTPNTPMAAYALNGKFYYSGTLTYDSAGDDGSDLRDFYEGTITVVANSPNVGLGFATATDNCTLFPTVTYTDGPLVPNVGCTYTGTVTRTWKAVDACGNETTCDQLITIVDNTPPTITCAPDVVVNPSLAELEDCDADGVNIVAPTASDNCDLSVAVTGVRSDTLAAVTPGPNSFPPGVTTITWTATDDCGNTSTCLQTVTVNAVSIAVNVELSPTIAPLPISRCITFEVFNCPNTTPQVVNKVLTFTDQGGAAIANDTICVPVLTSVTCITARDKLHTLRSRADTLNGALTGTGPYTANFLGKRVGEPGLPPGTGHRLVGGNLNDDEFIDILDFGTWAGTYLTNYGTGNTTCSTVGPHSDISGDGQVESGDFTFIGINFLMFREANCCGLLNVQPGAGDPFGTRPRSQPITRISVPDLHARGMSTAAAGDINHDGWLDMNDIMLAWFGLAPPTQPMPPVPSEPPVLNPKTAPVSNQNPDATPQPAPRMRPDAAEIVP